MVYAVAPLQDQTRSDQRHLRVLEAPKFSALPHEILRDTSLSRDARLLYAVLQAYWWQSGECHASHVTLAADLGCSTRMLRTYLTELMQGGLVTEHATGFRRQKSYRPVAVGTSVPTEPRPEPAVNRKFPTVQSEVSDSFNTSETSDSIKKTPEKKIYEEDLPPTEVGGAAIAASPPAPRKTKRSTPSRRKPRRGQETTVPDTIELTDQSYETATRWGFDRQAVDFQLERFLASARAKGRTYVDWKAAFRTWLLNEVAYAKRDGRAVGGVSDSRRDGPRSDDHLPSTVHRVVVQRF